MTCNAVSLLFFVSFLVAKVVSCSKISKLISVKNKLKINLLISHQFDNHTCDLVFCVYMYDNEEVDLPKKSLCMVAIRSSIFSWEVSSVSLVTDKRYKAMGLHL